MSAKTEFNRYIISLSEPELRKEIQKLYDKLKPVKEYYLIELAQDTSGLVKEYRQKITNAIMGRGGFPKLNMAEANKYISAFEKISVHPSDLADLLIHKVELGAEYIDEFGTEPLSVCSSTGTTYSKALRIISENRLEEMFLERCRKFEPLLMNYGIIDDSIENY